MGFVRRRDFELGWSRRVLGEEGFGLKRGESEGEERIVSMGDSKELEMVSHERKKRVVMFYMFFLVFGWFGFDLFCFGFWLVEFE
jgi:hypothetical protein